jgi:flagellar hook-associated protein 2
MSFSISGLGSGMDTQSMIAQLMQLERQPVVRFQQRQAQLRAQDGAWSSINAKMSSLRTAADALRQPTRLAEQMAVTSSAPDAVDAVRSGIPQTGSVSFTVKQLASKHQVIAGAQPFPAPDAAVGEGTHFTLRGADGAELLRVPVEEATTLSGLAGAINRGQRDVAAQVVKTNEGAYRLVLTARDTGAAKQFSIDTDVAGLAADRVTEGRDAHLQVGGLDVYRGSNTITDLVAGVSVTLKATSEQPVTIGVERDEKAVHAQVKGLVDALNSALSALKDASSTTRKGPLAGSSLIRTLTSELRQTVTGVVPGLTGPYTSASSIGISIQRDGSFKLDEARLTDAIAEDFDAVQRLFARTAVLDHPGVRGVGSTERTQTGSHTVELTRAARVAAATGGVYTWPLGEPKVLSVTAAGRTVEVTITAEDDVAAAVGKINAALLDKRLPVSVSEEGGALTFTHSRFGAAHGFTIAGLDDPDLDGEHVGEDVAGLINGVEARGNGQTLTAMEGPAEGLNVRIAVTPAELAAAGGTMALGSATVTQGLAGSLDRIMKDTTGAGGQISRSRDTVSSQIRRFDERILAFEDRLAIREKTLRKQFTALERTMGQFKAQSSWMSAQIAGMFSQQG